MNAKRSIIFFVAVLSALALLGCSFGLDPVWKETSQKPLFSLELRQLTPSDDESGPRAIAQGTGYLYIRTLGGPTGSSGPFYGPYSVSSGSTFTTTDIPEGSFSRFMILYSSERLDGSALFSFNGAEYIFSALMGLPDSSFTQFAGTDNPTSKALGDFFNGTVCVGESTGVTLSAGNTTSVSLTLVPISGSASTISVTGGASVPLTSSGSVKRFIRLEGITEPSMATITSLMCTLSASPGEGSLGAVAFFDRNGKPVAASRSGSSLESGFTWTLDRSATVAAMDGSGYVTLFLYAEYSGTVHASFDRTVTSKAGGNFTLSVSGAQSRAGRELYYFIVNTGSSGTGSATTADGTLGCGFFEIAPDGTGSASAVSMAGEPISMISGSYVILAFIDSDESSGVDKGLPSSGSANSGDLVYVAGISAPMNLDFSSPVSKSVAFSEFVSWSANWNDYSTANAYTVTVTSAGSYLGKNAYFRFVSPTVALPVLAVLSLASADANSVICALPSGSWTLDAFIDIDNSGPGASNMPTNGDLCIPSYAFDITADASLSIPTASFSNTYSGGTAPAGTVISIDGTPTADFMGRKVLLAVYDSAAIANLLLTKNWADAAPSAMTIVDLDASTGDGSASLSAGLTAGGTYYLSAQIDSTGHYGSLSGLGSVDLMTIVPYRGDYVTADDPTLAAAGVHGVIPVTPVTSGSDTAISLSAANFVPYNDYVVFASEGGSAAVAGETPANPTNLENAIALANANGSSATTMIYLVGSVGNLGSFAVTRSTGIQSYGSAAYSLSPSSSLSAAPLFSVEVGGYLSLSNVILACQGVSSPSQSFLTAKGELALGPGATLVGSSASSVTSGGGVYVAQDGIFRLAGGMISNCAATYGGAIFIDGGGACDLLFGSVVGNVATASSSAAIHAAPSSTVTLKSSLVTFTGNIPRDTFADTGASWTAN